MRAALPAWLCTNVHTQPGQALSLLLGQAESGDTVPLHSPEMNSVVSPWTACRRREGLLPPSNKTRMVFTEERRNDLI